MPSILRGLLIRNGQLRNWSARMSDRVGRLKPDGPTVRSDGAKQLLSKAGRLIGTALELLEQIEADISRDLGIHDEARVFTRILLLRLVDAELHIQTVERKILPLLITRSDSDPAYDVLLTRLLSELNLRGFQAVSQHKQSRQLSVDTSFPGLPIFLFTPSIRSFETLCLMYHEIGHLFTRAVLSAPDQGALCAAVARTFSTPRGEHFAHEVIADAFAGLTGGHAFASTLCGFCLSKQLRETERYPAATVRVWLARRASRAAGVPVEDGEDPLFATWDALLQLNGLDRDW